VGWPVDVGQHLAVQSSIIKERMMMIGSLLIVLALLGCAVAFHSTNAYTRKVGSDALIVPAFVR
jgi:hypothetical protein